MLQKFGHGVSEQTPQQGVGQDLGSPIGPPEARPEAPRAWLTGRRPLLSIEEDQPSSCRSNHLPMPRLLRVPRKEGFSCDVASMLVWPSWRQLR